jgi:hypothetical protein
MEMIRLTGKQKKEHLEMYQLFGICLLLLNSNRITGTLLQRTFLLIIAGMFFCFAQPYTIYFGDLHNHTELSDGTGIPEVAFVQAKNGKADFLAVTDHSWYHDPEWKRLGDAALNSTTATFCGIRGFEMTAGWGHMNVFNTQWYVGEQSIKTFYDMLVKHPEAIAQWNHPDYYMEPGSPFFYYSPASDSIINLLEIYNGKRGVLYEDEYRFALDKGWHVSPTANSDNHSATWITGYDFRTAILSSSLQRDSLLDALRKHRTYATMNRNLKILFTINDSIMGSVIHDSSSLLMKVSISDPDTNSNSERIARAIVYCNFGRVVTEQTFSAYSVKWEQELNQPQLDQGSYYYVKVLNSDGDSAITAPVWIDGKKFEPGKPVQPPPPDRITGLLFDLQGRQVAFVNNGDTRLLQLISSGVYVHQVRKGRTAKEHKILFMQSIGLNR